MMVESSQVKCLGLLGVETFFFLIRRRFLNSWEFFISVLHCFASSSRSVPDPDVDVRYIFDSVALAMAIFT